MRRALLVSAAVTFAIACTDNITEPVIDRTSTPASPATPVALGSPLAFATTTTEDGLSISTDKDDYQPGDVVHLTGYGWPANEVLDVKLDDEPVTHPPHTWTLTTGEDGTFHDSTYEVDYGDIDVKFTLTVTTRSIPIRSLTVQFTDGNPQTFTVVTAQAPNPVIPGTPATYTIQVNFAGNDKPCSLDLRATPSSTPALPASAFSFSPASVTGQGSGGGDPVSPQSTLTVNTTGLSDGTYQFTLSTTFSATQPSGAQCQGPGPTPLAVDLVVARQATTTAVTSSLNPSTTGDAVTFTATVKTGVPLATVTDGQVSFKTGGSTCADAVEVQAAQSLASGSVAYTPSPALALGSHTIRACYGGTATLAPSENHVVQQVNAPSNAAPVIRTIGNQTVDEEVELAFTAIADDNPAQTLTWSLADGAGGDVPDGAQIVPATGAFTWTPTELQGPGSYTFDVCVADNGTPSLSDCETITVTVDEVNVAPVLAGIGNKSTEWGDEVSFTATATDADRPANTLTFSLAGSPPTGASITSGGAFTWTPTSAQIGNHSITVRVSDDGSPVRYDEETISVTVNKRATTLVYTGAASGLYGGSIGVAATLTRTTGGAAIEGKSISFTLGTLGVSATTQSGGAAGLASASLTLAQNVGSYNVVSTFTADAEYLGSSDTDPFAIDPAPLSIKADNKTMFFGATAPPAFTVTPTGFVLGEGFSALGGTLTFSGPAATANSSTPVGSYVITPGGYTSTNYTISFVNGTLFVIYNNLVGHQFLQPVNPNLTTGNRSTFKIGSTIPVKFQIFLANGTTPVSTVVATISYVKVDNSVDASVNEEVVMGGADAGNSFRYDPVAQQYIFNLSTKTWTAGTWQLKATLDDGSAITALVDGRTK